MNTLDYILLELRYLVDVFVAENENKVEEDDDFLYDVDMTLEKLSDYHSDNEVLERVLRNYSMSDILGNVSEYDLRDYLSDNFCIEDFVDWR